MSDIPQMPNTSDTTNWPSFEELKNLAQNNPAKLEAWRKSEIDKLIDRASDNQKQRLRGLQFQIDGERRRHKTPLSRCIAISKKMHESLQELNHALAGLNGTQTEDAPIQNQPKTNAVVLNFPQASHTKAC